MEKRRSTRKARRPRRETLIAAKAWTQKLEIELHIEFQPRYLFPLFSSNTTVNAAELAALTSIDITYIIQTISAISSLMLCGSLSLISYNN